MIDQLWLDGKFEDIYVKEEDPWGCLKQANQFNNRLFVEMMFLFTTAKPFNRILDIGCGLGGLSDLIRMWAGGNSVLGVDTSLTAVNKAQSRYQQCDFLQWNILTDPSEILYDRQYGDRFDLIVMSEVLWYVCQKMDFVLEKIKTELLSGKGNFAIHQYFPEDQKYLCEYIDGMMEFELIMKQHKFQTIKRITISTETGPVLLGLYRMEESNG